MAGSGARTLGVPTLTFQDYLDTRPAGLDLMRLILAVLVLVSHTWPLGGFGIEPGSPLAPGFYTLGGFAVGGFFALSGLLVGRSALARSAGAFTRARVVRIVPAYWTALVVSGFGAALLGWWHDHRTLSGFATVTEGGPFAYVAGGALMPVQMHHDIHDVFLTSTPFGRSAGLSSVNGSLWTLPYEMRCYLVVGIVALIARRWGGRRTVTIAWVAAGMLALAYNQRPGVMTLVLGPYADARLVAFVFVFLTGTLVAVWADRIRLFGIVPIAALVIGLAAGHQSLFLTEHVAAAALALVLPPVAALLAPVALLLRGHDISYGMYLYAWPVQQLIAMYGWAGRPVTFIALTLAITTPLAVASWRFVERPAMRRWRLR